VLNQEAREMKTTKAERERRAALLVEQKNKCALCNEYMPTAFRMPYIPDQNAMICRACGQFMHVYQASIKRGITPEKLATFLASDPIPEPGTVVTVKPFKPNQKERGRLEARLAAARGQISNMTLADYDKRFGASGPVIDPDTGLEWVETGTNTDTENEGWER
jgi:hypothetical protein